ncbi:hypothetical protein EDD15DRAFT_1630580 [Pisolithus albus]|nr:hypothetical protein EDD15DRAFT_1630580 [Pisolithus albus]
MSAQVLPQLRLPSTLTYPKPTPGDTTDAAKTKRRPRTPTFSSLIRVPSLCMPVLRNKPSMPFGLGKRRQRPGLGTVKRETGVSDSPESSSDSSTCGHISSSQQIAWRSSQSSSSSSTTSRHAPYTPLDPPCPLSPWYVLNLMSMTLDCLTDDLPFTVQPPIGTKILERFWPENEPFSIGDADMSPPPLEDNRPGSLERAQVFRFEGGMSDDWTAGSGSGLGKEIPHRFSMLTPPPSRRVSRMQPLSTCTTAAQDIPYRCVLTSRFPIEEWPC